MSKNLGIKSDLAKMDPDEQIWAEKCLIWKDAFFQKNQLGIGPIRRKSEEMDQKWILEPFVVKFKQILKYIQVLGAFQQVPW